MSTDRISPRLRKKVRARMDETGEKYTEALAAILADSAGDDTKVFSKNIRALLRQHCPPLLSSDVADRIAAALVESGVTMSGSSEALSPFEVANAVSYQILVPAYESGGEEMSALADDADMLSYRIARSLSALGAVIAVGETPESVVRSALSEVDIHDDDIRHILRAIANQGVVFARGAEVDRVAHEIARRTAQRAIETVFLRDRARPVDPSGVPSHTLIADALAEYGMLAPVRPPVQVTHDWGVVTDGEDGFDRHSIPLAIGAQGQVFWKPRSDGHIALVGASGSGKSVALGDIVLAALAREWDVHVVGGIGGVYSFGWGMFGASRHGDIFEYENMLISVHDEMTRRFQTLSDHRAFTVDDLPDEVRPVPMLLVVDALDLFDADDDTEAVRRCGALLSQLVRTARAADVFIAVSANRARTGIARVIQGMTKVGFAGMSRLGHSVLFGSEEVGQIIEVPPTGFGRAYVGFANGGGMEVQFPFSDQDEMRKHLVRHICSHCLTRTDSLSISHDGTESACADCRGSHG